MPLEKLTRNFLWLWTGLALLLILAYYGWKKMPDLSQESTKEGSTQGQPSLTDQPKLSLTDQLKARGLRSGSPVFLRIFKEESEVEVWLWQAEERLFQWLKTYPILRYSGTLGPKLLEGDGQAPEGFYFVPARMMNPHSNYHLAFNLGYPNDYDRSLGRTGSAIMMHGSNVSVGCFAMGDPGIEEIYGLCDAALRGGQLYFRVHSFPFRMNPDRLARESESQWYDFWCNLRQGYDWFEEKRVPPQVTVKNGRYQFE